MKECLLYINIILTIFLSIIVISLLCEKNKDKYSNNEVQSNKNKYSKKPVQNRKLDEVNIFFIFNQQGIAELLFLEFFVEIISAKMLTAISFTVRALIFNPIGA